MTSVLTNTFPFAASFEKSIFSNLDDTKNKLNGARNAERKAELDALVCVPTLLKKTSEENINKLAQIIKIGPLLTAQLKIKEELEKSRELVHLVEIKAITCAKTIATIQATGDLDKQKLGEAAHALDTALKELQIEKTKLYDLKHKSLTSSFDGIATVFSPVEFARLNLHQVHMQNEYALVEFIQDQLGNQLWKINSSVLINGIHNVQKVVSHTSLAPANAVATKLHGSSPSSSIPSLTSTPSPPTRHLSPDQPQTPASAPLLALPAPATIFQTENVTISLAQLSTDAAMGLVESFNALNTMTRPKLLRQLSRGSFNVRPIETNLSVSSPQLSPDTTKKTSPTLSPNSQRQSPPTAVSPGGTRHRRTTHNRIHLGHAAVSADIQQLAKQNELARWPSFVDLIRYTGIASKENLTSQELDYLLNFSKKNPNHHLHAWDLMFKNTRAISDPKFLSTFEQVRVISSSGRPFTLYRKVDFVFLAHFSSLSNSERILNKEIASIQDPAIRESSDYFWNCQLKICTSIVQTGMQSYFSSVNKEGVGFAIDVPNAQLNLLHTFCRDTISPTCVLGMEAQSVSGNTGVESVNRYISFMTRYSHGVFPYISNLYQDAERADRLIKLRQKLLNLKLELEKIDPSKIVIGELSKIIASSCESLPTESDLNAISIELVHAMTENPTGFALDKDFLTILKKVSNSPLLNKKQISTKEALAIVLKEMQLFLNLTMRPQPYSENTLIHQPESLGKDKEPLLLRYVTDTSNQLKTILSQNPDLESVLFKILFKRDPEPKESVLRELAALHEALKTFCTYHYKDICKETGNDEFDLSIYAGVMTPDQLKKATLKGMYNEVNIRSHRTAKLVKAKLPRFKAVVVESSSLQYYIHPTRLKTLLGQWMLTGTPGETVISFLPPYQPGIIHISDELASRLEQARKARLPLLLI